MSDLNADGKSDLVFQHELNQTLAVWYLDEVTVKGAELLQP